MEMCIGKQARLSLLEGDYKLIEVSLSVEGANHGESHIAEGRLRDINLGHAFQVESSVDDVFALGFEDSQVLLLHLVHISLFIEVYMTQILFSYQALRYGLLHKVVDYVVQPVHLYVKNFCIVCIRLHWEYPDPSQRQSHLLELQRLQDLLPLWQLVLRVQSKNHQSHVEGVQGDQSIEVVFVNQIFDHIFVGLSAGLNQGDVNEVSRPFFTKRRPGFALHLWNLFLLLSGFDLLLIWFDIFFTLFPGVFGLLGVFLGGVVLEVAVEVVRVEVEVLVDLVDVVGVEVDVLGALELEFGQEEAFVAFKVVVGDQVGFAIDFARGGCDEFLLHANYNYYQNKDHNSLSHGL